VRDNGLPAQQWTHVADLDPRVADAALDALRNAGVAAYATPHPGQAGPYLDVQLPDRPTDRLYVEAGARERAAAVLADLQRTTSIGAPSGGDPREDAFGTGSAAEVDARFAEIVSQFDLSTAPQEPLSRPEDVPPDEPDDASPSGGRLLRGTYGWDDLLAVTARAQPAPEPEDEDEGYVPPPPPAVPRGTPLRRFAWAAVLGAPIVVVLCVLFSYGLDGWTGLLVVGAFIGGLVTLVATLDDRPLDDDGPDHGAVV
jgi:hypothetical protein